MESAKEQYNYSMRYYNKIFNLVNQGKDWTEIRKVYLEMQESEGKKHTFDFVRNMIALRVFGELLDIQAIENFILNNKKLLISDEIWKIIFSNSDPFEPADERGLYTSEAIRQSNTNTALFILYVLEGQKEIENILSRIVESKNINNNALLRFVNAYARQVENYDTIFANCVFWQSLLENLFLDFPRTYFPYDAKDLLLIDFIHLYKHLAPGVMKDLFEEHVIKKINNISEDVWNKEFGLSKNEIMEFVKRQYQYNKKFNNYTLESSNDLDMEKLKKIFEIIRFSGEEREEIESFLQKNPLSPLGQVHYVLTYYDERTDDDITSDKDIYKFIKDNIEKFSYEEMLYRVSHCITSDPLTEWELLIMFLLKDSSGVIDDISRGYSKGDINRNSLRYIIYVYPRLSRFGVAIDRDFMDQTRSFLM